MFSNTIITRENTSIYSWYHMYKFLEEAAKGSVITPRNSPRLYLRDARENYKLNIKCWKMVDEWKE